MQINKNRRIVWVRGLPLDVLKEEIVENQRDPRKVEDLVWEVRLTHDIDAVRSLAGDERLHDEIRFLIKLLEEDLE